MEERSKNSEQRRGSYTRFQRVLALIGVAALVLLAGSAFVVALMGGDSATILRLLTGAVFLPILIWLLLWATGKTPAAGPVAGSEAEPMEAAAGDQGEVKADGKN